MGVIYTHCSKVKYTPFTCFVILRYSLACSSDQKKTEFRQYKSMMVSSAKLFQSMSGMNTNGCASVSRTNTCMLLSIVKCKAWSQCLHFVSISTETYSFRNRPCTKGAASASSAQAPYRRSPLVKVNLCGVLSTVTGYAQMTAPASFRTRKNSFSCNSVRITFTCSSEIFKF